MELETGTAQDGHQLDQNLAALLVDTEQMLSVNITVKDQLGILCLQDGSALLEKYSIHGHLYCRLGRGVSPVCRQTCHAYCLREIPALARKKRKAFVSCCYRGAAEIVVPIFHHGELAFILLGGAFRDPESTVRPEQNGFPNEICKEFGKLKRLTQSRARQIARMFEALGKAILADVLALHETDGETKQSDDPREIMILQYLRSFAHQKLTLAQMAARLSLSPSRASHLIHQLTGQSFQALLLQERVRRAKSLLATSGMSLQQVAAACGFSNEFYFSRQFKNLTGMPPGQFLQMHRLSRSVNP